MPIPFDVFLPVLPVAVSHRRCEQEGSVQIELDLDYPLQGEIPDAGSKIRNSGPLFETFFMKRKWDAMRMKRMKRIGKCP